MSITLKCPVQLRGEQIKSFSDCINYIIEIVLCKHQYIKNNPRGNYLVWKTIWICIIIPSFILLLMVIASLGYDLLKIILNSSRPNIDTTKESFKIVFSSGQYLNQHSFKIYILPLMGVMSVVYWNLWKDYHSKWMYCCDVFNEILKADESKSNKLRRGLAVDLLVLDLWSHRSFREFFRDCLGEAIDLYVQEPDKDEIVLKFNNGEAAEGEAMIILEHYQRCNGTKAP